MEEPQEEFVIEVRVVMDRAHRRVVADAIEDTLDVLIRDGIMKVGSTSYSTGIKEWIRGANRVDARLGYYHDSELEELEQKAEGEAGCSPLDSVREA